MKNILLIDDDIKLTESIELNVGEGKYDWTIEHDGEAGLIRLDKMTPDLIISDIRMPKVDGLTFLDRVKQNGLDIPIIMITAYDDMQTTIRAMQLGAFEYVCKPIDTDELELMIERALSTAQRERRLNTIITEISSQYQMNNIIGSTPSMKEIFKTIGQVTSSRVSVLIQGESGTGKELIAKAVHYNSPYREAAFIPVNCSAIPEGLFESELFGHEKGAFTGAIATTRGKFEVCGDGTLFLDEIGDVPLGMQAKLLRVLQEREFYRVGGSKQITLEARVIAATHRDLEKMVEAGEFREDLYYRLAVVRIEVPPLRERKDDIPSLVEFLVDKINRDLGAKIKRIDPETMTSLKRFDFPGNVRELENVLRHAVVMAKGESLLPEYLPDMLDKKGGGEVFREFGFPDELVALEEIERRYIQYALQKTGWKKKKTCELLNIARTTLDRKLDQYNIKIPK
ncbi:sigma-54 dependent transcriptional regulator [bacterium]|nr:sigma-54 dependent transcriptional regulator [bacterium]